MNRLFLTGATGFIGGRMAEVAVERGIPTTALVRSWGRASRLARLPVDMVMGDVLDLESLRQAMKGCDTVIHCAVDNRVWGKAHRETSALGTRNVLQAAMDAGVGRVVHLSSIAVYGYRAAADAQTEAAAYGNHVDDYCQGKIMAEKEVLAFFEQHGLPVTILRPTIVYGPFGVETLETVDSLRNRTMVLVNGGTGICNSLHVDNLVDAALLAAEHDNAVGEIFHVSDAEPVTWREFVEPHARALGTEFLPIPDMTLDEISVVRGRTQRRRKSSLAQLASVMREPTVKRAIRAIPAVRVSRRMASQVARVLLPAPARQRIRSHMNRGDVAPSKRDAEPLALKGVPSSSKVDIYNNRVVFRIDKARDLLGYNPRIAFPEGIEQTIDWMKWARL